MIKHIDDAAAYWQIANSHYGVNPVRKDYNDIKKIYLSLITKVVFNDPATIVFWRDGSKTVVKCDPEDKFDPEKGLAMACTKKLFGNKGYYNDIFRKWLPEKEDEGPAKKVNFKGIPSTLGREFEKLAELAKEKEDK